MLTVDVDHQWWVCRAQADLETNIFACTAGLGSGKTHGAEQWHYDRCVLNKDVKFSAYMMPVYELIFNTALPTFEKVLDSYGVDYQIVKSPFPKIVFGNKKKQEIHFLSGNRPDKIKSVEYSHATIDEPGVTAYESIKRLRERVRSKEAVARQILLIGTPEGINWFADEFDSDENPGWDTSRNRDHTLERYNTLLKTTTRLRRFRLTTFDNEKYLPPDYIPNIFDTHRDNEAYIQSYVYGVFCALIEGNCYKSYHPQIHDCDDIAPDRHLDIALTFDFNANPVSWVSNQQRSYIEYGERFRRWIAIHEANVGVQQLDEACAEFAAKHPPELFGDTLIKVYGDSSGWARSHKVKDSDYTAIKKYLKILGFNNVRLCAMKYNPPQTASVTALNNMFSRDQLRVCKRCVKLRRSLTATKWKDGKREIEKPAGETHTHHSDAEKYFASVVAEDTPAIQGTRRK